MHEVFPRLEYKYEYEFSVLSTRNSKMFVKPNARAQYRKLVVVLVGRYWGS